MSSFHFVSLPCMYLSSLFIDLLSAFQIAATQSHSKYFNAESQTYGSHKHLLTLYRKSYFRIFTAIAQYVLQCLDKQ